MQEGLWRVIDGFESNNSDSVLERDARGLVETVMDLSLRQRLC